MILADLYGADGSQPSNTTWPCASGNCANWVTFLDDVVGAIQASGVTVAYDIWNEPDESIFWAPGTNTTQYFQMWDTAVKTIRSLAPGALLLGPLWPLTRRRTRRSGRRGFPPSSRPGRAHRDHRPP